MLDFRAVRREERPLVTGVALVAVVSFAVLVWAAPGRAPGLSPPGSAASLPGEIDGLVAGLFVAAAVAGALAGWRSPSNPVTGWPAVTGTMLASQALVVTLLALHLPPASGPVPLAALLAVAIAGLVAVVLSLAQVDASDEVTDDCFGLGLGMGLMAAAYVLPQVSLVSTSSVVAQVVVGVLVATQVTAVTLVLRRRLLGRATGQLLVPTVLVGALGLLVGAGGLGGTAWDLTASTARAAIGAAWVVTALCFLRRSRAEARRRAEEIDAALKLTRDHRERLHELRSTMAGLVNGSELLDRPEMPPEVRARLWVSVRRELDRMSRLLSEHEQSPVDLDLDRSLDLILDLQRLKGRHVELRGSSESVRAHYDSLAEVVNILIDNAVAHGGTDSSVVEVLRRDEDTVDIAVTDFGRGIPQDQRSHIFDWGRRGSDSAGEGIGLHVAQRLVREDGGSLRMRDVPHSGSSFVISLPAARRSTENIDTTGVAHAWRRSG